MDDTDPYPTLLGIDWAFDNQVIFNLKKRQIIVEGGDIRVIAPLDLWERDCYVDLVKGELSREDLDNIYNVIKRQEDYVNLTANKLLSWCNIGSCASDSEEALENWKARIHEVSTRRCTHITRMVRWIRISVYNSHCFDKLSEVEMMHTVRGSLSCLRKTPLKHMIL